MTFVSHKIELRTNASQSDYIRRCCGTMRFVYNQLVAKWKSGEKYNRKVFQKFCSDIRRATPWMKLVGSRAVYEAADNFHSSVGGFFRTCKRIDGKKWNPPVFKKKGKKDSCQFSYQTQFSVTGRRLRIQGLKEKILMRERVRFSGRVKSVAIKLHCGKWYAIFLVEVDDKPKPDVTQKPSVGIDFGLKSLAVLSSGEVIENPKPLQRSLKKMKRLQRRVSRRYIRGEKVQSGRFRKASKAVARLYKKIADQRSAAQHKFTTDAVKKFSRITIEDLNVSGMLKNKKLARAIHDASWSSLRHQLEYKCKMSGVGLVIADRFFASSKTCSGCGHKLESLSLNQRTFNCPECSLSLDRDLNAAINLDNYGSMTPPIRGSHKTDRVGLRKTASAAGPIEPVNISPLRKNEGCCQLQ